MRRASYFYFTPPYSAQPAALFFVSVKLSRQETRTARPNMRYASCFYEVRLIDRPQKGNFHKSEYYAKSGFKPRRLKPICGAGLSALSNAGCSEYLSRPYNMNVRESSPPTPQAKRRARSAAGKNKKFYYCRRIILSAIFFTNTASCSTNKSVGLNERISSSTASLDITST